ncbi:hypothetical protein E3O19_01445 [Cryobacterium algoritolerans]|uniref:Uncharacterized protein n=1 Tax=Cryobacterium algoritolerans TaxID=1259184 RepID=A0A4R8WY38_9MICO|nr:hypothetical protein [Cryobacterium algoritolerans]TFC20063.1 hypothetical protein E3O19_01445 [Cryobacterium algoritolerans]
MPVPSLARPPVIILAGLIALAFTGCTSTPSAPAAATATPTPYSTEASVSQWDSVVAGQKDTLDRWQTKWDKDQCSGSDGSTSPCRGELLEGSMIASTISMTLGTGAGKDTPPAEISGLYASTAGLAHDAAAAGQAWQDSCNATAAPECAGLSGSMEISMRVLSMTFAKWAPYL